MHDELTYIEVPTVHHPSAWGDVDRPTLVTVNRDPTYTHALCSLLIVPGDADGKATVVDLSADLPPGEGVVMSDALEAHGVDPSAWGAGTVDEAEDTVDEAVAASVAHLVVEGFIDDAHVEDLACVLGDDVLERVVERLPD